MKLRFHRSAVALLAATGLLVPRAGSAAGLTVTPSAVSNTYSGFITLTITGLTNHEQVTVQTYLDLNGNGAVDAGEPLVDAFKINESGANLIGGITNISVPFDSNSATDTITTTLSFAPPIESVVGQKIYRVVSPSGRFAPVLATLVVTNAALNQAVRGTVFAGGLPVPGALVVALSQPNNNFVSSALCDGSGNYFLKLPSGSYGLLPTLPGYYADQSALPLVTLTNGVTATNNLFLTNGTVIITGQIYDSATSNGLGGVFLQVESGNFFGVVFSDTNGTYTAGVTSNVWKIKLDAARLARRGFVAPQGSLAQPDASLGNVSNVNLAITKGNALLYGRVTVGGSTPLPNLSIAANDSQQQIKGEGFTDANGNYAVVALIDTNNFPGSGTWYAAPNNDNAVLASYIISQGFNVPLTNGEAVQMNFSALPVTGRISGRIQNIVGNPVGGVGVSANAVIGGTPYSTAFVGTDGGGNYSFGAADGQWTVNVNCCGNDGLDSQGYYDPVTHSVNVPPTNAVANITVYPIGTPYLSQPMRQSSTQFGFLLSGASGSNYTVQASTNLGTTNWFTVLIVTNLPGNFYFIQDNQATNGQRFYRVRLGP